MRPTLDDWTAITDGVSESAILQLARVNPRTLKRWRAGLSRMPHATALLLRMVFKGELPPRGTLWRGWAIGHDGLLYAPDLARGFTPGDLYTLHWLKQTEAWRTARAAVTLRDDPAAPGYPPCGPCEDLLTASPQ
jgi:hypothetical protein